MTLRNAIFFILNVRAILFVLDFFTVLVNLV